MIPDFKELFEKCPGLYLVLDSAFTIVAVTDAYLAATKTKRNEITGKGIFEVFPDNPADLNVDGVSNLRASLQRVVDFKQTETMGVQKYEIRVHAEKGGGLEEKHWSFFHSPILDEKGNVKYIIHRVEDVSEFIKLKNRELTEHVKNEVLGDKNDRITMNLVKRSLEIENANKGLKESNGLLEQRTKELERSAEELLHFAETAAHDIKAPFRGVGMYLDIMKSKITGKIYDPEIDESFDKIAAARFRISTLLDDLLNYARVSYSTARVEVVDVKKIIKDLLASLQTTINETGAKITISGDLPPVKGDPGLINQVFRNIISNAIKFQDTNKPEISIAAQKKGSMVEFAIKDNGIGMDPKYFHKIFQVFERLNSQSDYPGSGLGLAICQRIIERHGGKIWAKSELGKGTTFYFTLRSA